MSQSVPSIVHIKKRWYLNQNPFPSQGIARLGGDDLRENGLLFDPGVQEDKVREAAEKFALGAAYSGLKFGFLWSLGTGLHGDARGVRQVQLDAVSDRGHKRRFRSSSVPVCWTRC